MRQIRPKNNFQNTSQHFLPFEKAGGKSIVLDAKERNTYKL